MSTVKLLDLTPDREAQRHVSSLGQEWYQGEKDPTLPFIFSYNRCWSRQQKPSWSKMVDEKDAKGGEAYTEEREPTL